MKILIVDDNKRMRNLIKQVLSKLTSNNIFIECQDGEQAVEICGEEHPDFVLMDIVMNRLDGLKATQKIVAENKTVKVIIVSQLSEDEYRQEALNSGAVEFLNKENLFLLPELIRKFLITK